jgi:hypothetical protein
MCVAGPGRGFRVVLFIVVRGIVRADRLGALGDRLGRWRVAVLLGLGHEGVGRLLRLVVPLLPAREHLDVARHDGKARNEAPHGQSYDELLT